MGDENICCVDCGNDCMAVSLLIVHFKYVCFTIRRLKFNKVENYVYFRTGWFLCHLGILLRGLNEKRR